MDYNDALAYIIKAYQKGAKHGLHWIERILEQMGGSHQKLKIIHVAGTNGKGSTCAMLDSIFQACGYSTGMFTSPHLMSFNERIRINGRMISNEDFAYQVQKIRDIMYQLTDDPNETLSFFEILTIMAFQYFYEKKVDIAIIETGLGGRLDSTNVVKNPLLSIITAISYDHMEILGDTLEKIAFEKAGIIKENCPLVLYSSVDKVYNTIIHELRQKQGHLYYFQDGPAYIIHEMDLNGTEFSISSNLCQYNRIRIPLLGEYQVLNACHVLLAVEALRAQGIDLHDTGVYRGLKDVRWPGRMEIVCNNPPLILDGAHNADGAVVFDKCLGDYFGDKKIIVVAGVLQGKDYHKIINTITHKAVVTIVTQSESKKAVPAHILGGCIEDRHKEIIIEPDYKKAMDRALAMAGGIAVIAVSGSFWLIGDIKKYLLNEGVVSSDRF